MNDLHPQVQDYLKWKNRNRYYYDCLREWVALNVPPQARVLELGSGDGELLASVQPAYGVGIEQNQALVEYALQRHPQLKFIQMDAHQLYLVETFDYIILANLLGEAQDIQTILKQMSHVCHSHSKIIIIQYNYLWEPVLRFGSAVGLRRPASIQNWLSDHDLKNLLEVCDYRTIRQSQRVLLPRWIPLLSNWVNRYLAILPGINRCCLVTMWVASLNPKPLDPTHLHCSVIIPTKNERGNIKDAVRRTPILGDWTELIFVDGRSTDGTVEEIQRMIHEHPNKNIRLLFQDGQGKGSAVRQALAAARGEVLMILDSDLTMPPEDLPKYFDALTSGKGEFINGSRLVYQREDESMRFLNLIANKIFAVLFSWLLEQKLKDTLCGTKVFWKRDYEKIATNRTYFGDFDPFGDFDLLFGAAKLNLKMVEIPIRYKARTYGDIKIERFKHGWLLLKMCWVAFKKLKL